MDKYSKLSRSQLIDELHRLEEKYSALEQTQNLLFNGPVVVFKWRNSDDFPVDYVSPNVADIFGYTVDDFRSGRVLYADIIAMPDYERVLAEVKKAEEDNIWAYDHSPYRIISKDGSERYLKDHTVVVRNENNEITHYYGYVFEVNQQKTAEHGFDSSELRAQAILNNTNALVYIKDLQGHYLQVNLHFEDLFHLSRDEIIGKSEYDLYPVEIADALRADDISVLEKRHLIEVEESIFLENKLHNYISLKFPINNNKGEIYAVCCISMDVSKRERAELSLIGALGAYSAYSGMVMEIDERGNDLVELSHQINERLIKHSKVQNALYKSEQRFQNLLEQLPLIAVQGYDNKRQVIFWNEASEHLYGYTAEEALGSRLENLIFPDSTRNQMIESSEQSLKTGLSMRAGELKFVNKEGISIPVFSSYLAESNAADEPVIYKIDMDLSRLYEARKNLEKANVEWEQIFDSVADPIFILDSKHHIVRANKALIDRMDRDANPIIGEICNRCVRGEYKAVDDCPYLEIRQSGQQCVIEKFEENLGDDFLIKVTPLYNLDDVPIGSIHVAHDISERNRAEKEKLDQLEKQKDALVQEVHHRIKNHLHGLMGLLKQRINGSAENIATLNDAISQIESISIVYGLQAGNPGSQLYFDRMLEAIVQNMAELSQVTLSLSNDSKQSKFLIDGKKAVSLALVINELLMNAVKHFYSAKDNKDIRIRQSLQDGSIRLTISNPGILPDDFDFDLNQGFGVGLDLLKVMLPGQGAKISIKTHGDEVTAELVLGSPLLSSVE